MDPSVILDNKVPFGHSLGIDRIIGPARHRRIDDRDESRSLGAGRRTQRRQVAIALRADREDPIAVHVVDIEMQHRQWDLTARKACKDLARFDLGAVAPAALVIAQRPARRDRMPAGQARVALEHRGVIPHRHPGPNHSANKAHLDVHRGIVARRSHRELGIVGVLDEGQRGTGGAPRHHHGDRGVERVLPRTPRPAGISVPQPQRHSPQVEARRLLSEAADRLGRPEAPSIGAPGASAKRRQLVIAQSTREIEHRHSGLVDPDHDGLGAHRDLAVMHLDRDRTRPGEVGRRTDRPANWLVVRAPREADQIRGGDHHFEHRALEDDGGPVHLAVEIEWHARQEAPGRHRGGWSVLHRPIPPIEASHAQGVGRHGSDRGRREGRVLAEQQLDLEP